jgi:phosphoglycolate phosphatase
VSADLKLVVFDMDGTLIDSQANILEAMRRGFRSIGDEPPADAATLSIVGLSLPEAMARLAPGASEAKIGALADAYKQSFVDLRSENGAEAQSPLYPGARAALERLATQDETLMGVATGKAMRGLRHALNAHDLGGFFQTLQTADGHPSKPHPSMLTTAMAETGTERGVMVGDTEFDIHMAKAAGLAAIGVAWGYHPVAQLHAAGADIVVDRFDALDAAIDEIWARR